MAAISAAVDLKSSMNGTADPFDDPELDPVSITVGKSQGLGV